MILIIPRDLMELCSKTNFHAIIAVFVMIRPQVTPEEDGKKSKRPEVEQESLLLL